MDLYNVYAVSLASEVRTQFQQTLLQEEQVEQLQW